MVDTVKILGALLGGGNMSSGSGANILKSVIGAAVSGGQKGSGGLGDLLGSIMKSGQSSGSGLGDILGNVLGSNAQPSAQDSNSGGLGELVGGLLRGNSEPQQQKQSGDLEGLLGGLLGGSGGSKNAGLSDLVSSALNQFGNAENTAQSGARLRSFEEHSPGMIHSEACDQATIMIRAMANAAKADGRLDKEEQGKIMGKLGSVTQDEIDFVNHELEQPLDVEGFARSVPNGMENQVYGMSLMAIDLDSNAEGQYLHQLAQAMNIEPQVANQIHRQVGAPILYS